MNTKDEILKDHAAFEDDSVWIDINQYAPMVNIPVKVCTSHGVREAIMDFGGYRLTDCTHPLQNTNLQKVDILGWRFCRREDIVPEPKWIRTTHTAPTMDDYFYNTHLKSVEIHCGGEYSYGIKDKQGNFKFVCRTPFTVKTKAIKRIWFHIKMLFYDLTH